MTKGKEKERKERKEAIINLGTAARSVSIDNVAATIIISADRIDKHKCRISVSKDSTIIHDIYITGDEDVFKKYEEVQEFFLGKVIDKTGHTKE